MTKNLRLPQTRETEPSGKKLTIFPKDFFRLII